MAQLPGFIGGSYTAQSTNIDTQRCVNLYPQMDESGTGKNVAALISTPGLKVFCDLTLEGTPPRPVRGMIVTSLGRLFIVIYTTLYEVMADGTAIARGSLTSSAGLVGMADNGQVLMLVDIPGGYQYDLTTNTLTQLADFAGGVMVVFQDGYFVFNQPNSQVFWVTNPYSTKIDGTYFASAEGSPDQLSTVLSDHENLWLFGTDSIEIWYASGGADFPFQRVSGGVIPIGLAAPRAACRVFNTVAWLGQDQAGRNIVWAANGFTPQRISTHAVEQAIARYAKTSDATAYGYQQDGHSFLVLNFPTGGMTWVYDFVSQLWHERAYTGAAGLERHRGEMHAVAFGKHIVSDYANPVLYEMTPLAVDDAGNPITRMRVAPYVTDELKNVFISKLQLDVETGVGADGGAAEPQCMLQWSDDGGHTWSNEYWTGLGLIGQTSKRVIWRRLGRTRERVFKVVVTDPCPVSLVDAFIDVTEGRS